MQFRLFTIALFSTFICFNTMAQNKYDKAWKSIDTLIVKKGLPESALKEVNKVYAMAKLEKKNDQLVKALIYRIQLAEQKEEDATLINIKQLEKEIPSVSEPAKSILQNILAGLYWDYFDYNRSSLYDRTETITFKKNDIATWSEGDFYKKTGELYLASLKNEALLKKTSLESYEAIIVKGNTRKLRPTLFDLLTFRALEYFGNDEMDTDRPAYAFEIDQSSAFDPAADFINRKFITKDSSSLHHKALLLYQRLLAFHVDDKTPDALIDADIHRLQFVNEFSTIDNAEESYINALNHIALQYAQHPAAAQAWYLIASHYRRNAKNQKKDSINWNLKAKEICEKVLNQKDSSEGFINCSNLLKEITAPSLSLQAEIVNIPNQPFRALIKHKNVSKVYFRVIPVTPAISKIFDPNNYNQLNWDSLYLLKATHSFTQVLPASNDYKDHSAEVAIDPLPVGEYILLASITPEFKTSNNYLSCQQFHVSNIAYFNEDNNYYVVNRETGWPVPRASVQVWYSYYDAASQKNSLRKGENLFTDKNGYFNIPKPKTNGNNNYRIELTTADDHLFLYNHAYLGASSSSPIKETFNYQTYLFTDRGIYRPGQTIHFKGIVVKRSSTDSKPVIADHHSTILYLYDTNGEVVDSLAATTSDYGSYSGKFQLPANRLTGSFSFRDNTGNYIQTIQVEEYKRPKFNVSIETPEGTYKVNQTITVKGKAKAFAGNAVDGAKVVYTVRRITNRPVWMDDFYRGKIGGPQQGKSMEITHGATITKPDGSFEVTFTAIPDAGINKKELPIFSFQINADITDINGETHSSSTTIQVGYHSLMLSIETPESLPADSLKTLTIHSNNLNNVYEKAKVTLTIQSLKMPNRLFRERYWSAPDQFLYSQEEYYKLFPYDIYQEEDQPKNWPILKTVATLTDSTKENGQFDFGKTALEAGWYVLEAITQDKDGIPVNFKKIVELTGDKSTSPKLDVTMEIETPAVEPGEKARYSFSSNLDSVWLYYSQFKNQEKPVSLFQKITMGKKMYEEAITEKDRGIITHSFQFVKMNRFFTKNYTIIVPFTNKDLGIRFDSYRDKTLPGNEEKWKLHISGYKTDKVLAEYLTAMYDASLDEFAAANWNTSPVNWFRYYYTNFESRSNFNSIGSNNHEDIAESIGYFKEYDQLLLESSEDPFWWLSNIDRTAIRTVSFAAPRMMTLANQSFDAGSGFISYSKESRIIHDLNSDSDGSKPLMKEEENKTTTSENTQNKEKADKNPSIQIRKNFNETAFFFPDLKTDSAGDIEFSFTMPEALTSWKWMSLAHTKDLAFGYATKTIVTQKDLMVQANAPRFFREGDRMDFSAKIVNLTDKELTGQVELQLIDPTTNQPVDGWFRNFFPNQYFTVPAKQSVPASFTIEIPFLYNKPVIYRLIARAGDKSDGEEMALPVLSNRTLVTESLPLNIKGSGTKSFHFDKLEKSGASESLTHQSFTIEMTSNPAWYALQALPYLMEFPYECAEQNFNRYYSNALAAMIVRSSPRIQKLLASWKASGSKALESNLSKNPELKALLLEETPWVMEAKDEAQQKKNIALLFDTEKMNNEMTVWLDKLAAMQTTNGGFPWFAGGPEDRYITQYILSGIGHLKKLKALPLNNDKLTLIISKAIPYLDNQLKKSYDVLVANKSNLNAQQSGVQEIQYLYMRSFFTDKPVAGDVFKAYNFYRKQSQQFWQKASKYMQGMIALSLFRTGDVQTALDILKSLQQNAIVSEEMGMYWKEFNTGGFSWYQSPIESHSLLVEAFAEIKKDNTITDNLKTWLLKQKQTNNWRTTKATAEACYALLMSGSDWLSNEPTVSIKAGNMEFTPAPSDIEAGTGYFKKSVEGVKVMPGMGNMAVTISSATTGGSERVWGAAYWQYFEDLDQITPSTTPLKLTKKLFVERNTDKGKVLEPVAEDNVLHVGDKVIVRIELRTDRDLEYVHMKDMRAASLEPVNVISGYNWKGGLGYYESTRDASTNFFFSSINRGTYVFEYPLFVTHTGTFSNGISSIQCMYAPEFTAHSEGVKVRVE